MEIIIFLIAAAVLAFQISIESSLAYTIKRFLYLDFENQCLIKKLSKVKFWSLLWGLKYYILLYPISVVFSLFFKFWYFLSTLLSCPYCLSFHLAWIGFHFIYGIDLFTSFMYGLITMIAVKIYERI